MDATNPTTLPRNSVVYRYLREDGVVANIISMVERGVNTDRCVQYARKYLKAINMHTHTSKHTATRFAFQNMGQRVLRKKLRFVVRR